MKSNLRIERLVGVLIVAATAVSVGASPGQSGLADARAASVISQTGSGMPCPKPQGGSVDVEVNCGASDAPIAAPIQLAQSEPSVVAYRNKIVVAFNDRYEQFENPRSLIGYSVSDDGAVSFRDMGALARARWFSRGRTRRLQLMTKAMCGSQ